MILTDEILMAYADCELSGEDLRRVEAALQARPDLMAMVEQQRALRRALEGALEASMQGEVPERLLKAVMETPVSRRWIWRQRLRQWRKRFANRRVALWTGLPAAAALACGVLIGIAVAPHDALRIDAQSGATIAEGSLKHALDTQLASAQDANAAVRIGISFKAKDGRYCRTFETGGAQSSLAGVACRGNEGWSVAALASAPAETGSYRMAGAMPDPVRRAVAGLIAGEPLDAAGEKRARDAGW